LARATVNTCVFKGRLLWIKQSNESPRKQKKIHKVIVKMSDLDDDLLALADGMDIEDDQVQQGSGKDTGDHSGNDNNIEDSDNDDDYNFLQKSNISNKTLNAIQ